MKLRARGLSLMELVIVIGLMSIIALSAGDLLVQTVSQTRGSVVRNTVESAHYSNLYKLQSLGLWRSMFGSSATLMNCFAEKYVDGGCASLNGATGEVHPSKLDTCIDSGGGQRCDYASAATYTIRCSPKGCSSIDVVLTTSNRRIQSTRDKMSRISIPGILIAPRGSLDYSCAVGGKLITKLNYDTGRAECESAAAPPQTCATLGPLAGVSGGCQPLINAACPDGVASSGLFVGQFSCANPADVNYVGGPNCDPFPGDAACMPSGALNNGQTSNTACRSGIGSCTLSCNAGNMNVNSAGCGCSGATPDSVRCAAFNVGFLGVGSSFSFACKAGYSGNCTVTCGGSGALAVSGLACTLVTEDGQCGPMLNSCNKGNFADIADTSTDYKWQCASMNGGATVTCSSVKAPIIGACGSTQNTCAPGTLVDLADTATDYKWQCKGENGGADTDCTLSKAANPLVSPLQTQMMTILQKDNSDDNCWVYPNWPNCSGGYQVANKASNAECQMNATNSIGSTYPGRPSRITNQTWAEVDNAPCEGSHGTATCSGPPGSCDGWVLTSDTEFSPYVSSGYCETCYSMPMGGSFCIPIKDGDCAAGALPACGDIYSSCSTGSKCKDGGSPNVYTCSPL